MDKENCLLMVCHECDALQNIAHALEGEVAVCLCCGRRLFRNTTSSVEKTFALMVACSILFLISNVYPLVVIHIAGIERELTLIGSAYAFFEQGNAFLSLVVLFSSVLLPGLTIFSLVYISASIYYKKSWRFTFFLLVWVTKLLPWNMMDVFLLAILVALVKLSSLADIVLGVGFIAFIGLVLCYAAAISSLEMHKLWSLLGRTS